MKTSHDRALTVLLTLILVGVACVRPAHALNPESPQVRAIINPAVQFMRTVAANEQRWGGKALIGMAILKATHDKEDRDVRAMAAAVARTASLPVDRLSQLEDSQYSLGIALMFLCSLNPEEYKPQIENLVGALVKNQQPDGSWTYNTYGMGKAPSGDTSQTQYGCMSLWVAHRKAGVPVDPKVFERALSWLMRTQRQHGGFAYQPDHPPEANVTISLTAAGAGSVLICAEALGMLSDAGEEPQNSALTKVTERGAAVETRSSIPKANVMATVGRANNYYNTNFGWNKQPTAYYYFMYAMERYQTFLDKSRGVEEGDTEPRWYNEGVEVLRKRQQRDGSFSESNNGRGVCAAFAVLFLTRATHQTLEPTVGGLLAGGKGLPKDAAYLHVDEDGKVIGAIIKDELHAVLELIDKDDVDYSWLVRNLPVITIEKVDARKRDAEMEELRKRIASPKARHRLVAVHVMAKDSDLDVVPGLIYALTDPETSIAIEARDGLRFVSRRFDGFGMPNKPNDAQKRAAQLAWKDWLRSIRPNAKFILE